MKELLKERRTGNLKQLKKYVDKAIELGATHIRFHHFDSENPYFVFEANLTEEELLELNIQNLKTEFENRLKNLQKTSFKTHFIRVKEYGLCGAAIENIINDYKKEHKITNPTRFTKSQEITDDYDDWEDGMQTIRLVEIINNK